MITGHINIWCISFFKNRFFLNSWEGSATYSLLPLAGTHDFQPYQTSGPQSPYWARRYIDNAFGW
jgi:hypothetical protein